MHKDLGQKKQFYRFGMQYKLDSWDVMQYIFQTSRQFDPCRIFFKVLATIISHKTDPINICFYWTIRP